MISTVVITFVNLCFELLNSNVLKETGAFALQIKLMFSVEGWKTLLLIL